MMYTYTHTYIYTYIHTYIYTYTIEIHTFNLIFDKQMRTILLYMRSKHRARESSL